MYLVIRYIHFTAIILLASMLIAENIFFTPKLSSKELRKLVVIDGIYGACAIITLVAGGLLWLSGSKPASFYSSNPIFHAKLGLFVLVALLSIAPTAFLLKNRKTQKSEIAVPNYLLVIVKVEVSMLFILPFLAVLMAQGYGYS
ncbi:DUF2214 family protein [Marinagarivorans cellulosilyticus]|uniref:DUF2214 family protein n=1 Tax=Marinagarivorans cellulosilyticus TaxID=2721545 RepID=UPI0021043C0C|nr:DUF2214 family protein [Marinagarivorans cellulosilyticus]